VTGEAAALAWPASQAASARAAAVLAADAASSQVLAGRVAVVPRVPPSRPGAGGVHWLP